MVCFFIGYGSSRIHIAGRTPLRLLPSIRDAPTESQGLTMCAMGYSRMEERSHQHSSLPAVLSTVSVPTVEMPV